MSLGDPPTYNTGYLGFGTLPSLRFNIVLMKSQDKTLSNYEKEKVQSNEPETSLITACNHIKHM